MFEAPLRRLPDAALTSVFSQLQGCWARTFGSQLLKMPPHHLLDAFPCISSAAKLSLSVAVPGLASFTSQRSHCVSIVPRALRTAPPSQRGMHLWARYQRCVVHNSTVPFTQCR